MEKEDVKRAIEVNESKGKKMKAESTRVEIRCTPGNFSTNSFRFLQFSRQYRKG
jgi:hypothetical protein